LSYGAACRDIYSARWQDKRTEQDNVRGTNTNCQDDPNTASRYTKTNIFKEESAGFKAMKELKKVHQGAVAANVKNVDLISLRQQ
jgi:hypothetical protein